MTAERERLALETVRRLFLKAAARKEEAAQKAQEDKRQSEQTKDAPPK